MKNNFPKKSVNQRITDARILAHLTQQEMGEKLGINRSTYAYMERNGNPSPERIARIAEILNVSVDYLVNGEKDISTSLNDASVDKQDETQKKSEQFQMTDAEKRIIKMLRMLPRSEASKIKSDLKKTFEEFFLNK